MSVVLGEGRRRNLMEVKLDANKRGRRRNIVRMKLDVKENMVVKEEKEENERDDVGIGQRKTVGVTGPKIEGGEEGRGGKRGWHYRIQKDVCCRKEREP